MTKTKNRYTDRLVFLDCIERNYEDFKKSIMQMDAEDIYDHAAEITAVNDVHFYLTVSDWVDAEEVECLMQFENPLKLLADAWQEEQASGDSRFGQMLVKIAENDYEDYTGEYVTVSLADELREKYGYDMPLDAAIVREIVGLGRKLLNSYGINSFDDAEVMDFLDEL